MATTNLQFIDDVTPIRENPVNLGFAPSLQIPIIAETLTLTPSTFTIRKDRGVFINTASMALAGQTQEIKYRRDVSTNPASATWVDAGNIFVYRQESRIVDMNPSTVMTLTGSNLPTTRARYVDTTTQNLQLIANPQPVTYTRFVTAYGEMQLTGSTQTLVKNRGVNISTEYITLTPEQQDVVYRVERIVFTTTVPMTLTPTPVDIVKDTTVTLKTARLKLRPSNFHPAEGPGLHFVLSGGANNTIPFDSIGGVASTNPEGIVVDKSAFLESGSVSGVSVVGVQGGSEGLFTLQWINGLQAIRWTGPDGFDGTAKLITSGIFRLPVRASVVFLSVDYQNLPVADVSATYTVFRQKNPLLDDLLYGERGSNHLNYRCMWINNATDAPLYNVVLETSGLKYGNLELGSEYATAGLSKIPSAEYVEHSNLTYAGKQFLAANTVGFAIDAVDYYYEGAFEAPSYNSGVVSQNSDGSSTQLPFVLADEYDSTDVLSGLEFSNKLIWPTIAANSYVSFWVKRYIEANTSGSLTESEFYTLRLLYEE